jgi:hypothetical protein
MAKRAARRKPPTGRPRGGPPHTLWKKGAPSPNPGGRPALFAELREAAQLEGPASIRKLAEIRDNPKAPYLAQIAAANSLLDRGYGRPMQSVAIAELPKPGPIQHVTPSMSAEEAGKLYEQTIRGHYDSGGAGQKLIDVTIEPESGDDQS